MNNFGYPVEIKTLDKTLWIEKVDIKHSCPKPNIKTPTKEMLTRPRKLKKKVFIVFAE